MVSRISIASSLLSSCVSVLFAYGPPRHWIEGPEFGELHYFYHRTFLQPHPLPWHPPIQGYSHKHGKHISQKLTSGSHYKDEHFPIHPGFVPVYNPHSYDLSYGLAEGRDLVGPFSHFTGPFGPFGFWANLLHDKK